MAGLLSVRKVADDSVPYVTTNDTSGRVIRINPETGQEISSLPLKGVRPEGELPEECTVGNNFVARAISEGWASLVNQRVVFRPSGPANDRWGSAYPPHAFIQADAVLFHFIDGDVRYDVVHQPDKYAASGDDATIVDDTIYQSGDTRVDHFYGLRLVK